MKTSEMADELAANFFRVYIMRGDCDTRWTVECEYRQGHNENKRSLTAHGSTMKEAIRNMYRCWKTYLIAYWPTEVR